MRAFLAVNLLPAMRDELYHDVRALRSAARGVKWVAAEQLHFTVKFLGDQSDDVTTRVVEQIGPVARAHRAFTMTLAGVGAFPNLRVPRVVWLGVQDERPFVTLAHAVDEACTTLGVEPDQRAPRAHLTLGRVKQELSGAESAVLMRAAAGIRASHRVRVGSVDLMRSELGREGSRYTVLAQLPLGESPVASWDA